jgi:hypothetical protein
MQNSSRARIFLILLISFPFLVFSQQYIEASGQTKSFDLKAGAKAGWDNTASGIRLAPGATGFRSFISITKQFQRNLAIEGAIPAGSSCALYSLNGHLCARLVLTPNNTFILPNNLNAGYYIARIKTPSSVLSSITFLATR